jgi:hypothetical protein
MTEQRAANEDFPWLTNPASHSLGRRIRKVVLSVLLFFLVLLIYAAWPGSSTFTVSPETTYVTGPLDKHGYVDYVTALNERLSKGITPENNANVLIWKALGPRPEGATMPPEYFKWLGIESPPDQGDYLVSYTDYLKKKIPADDYEKREVLTDRMGKAAKWPWTAKDEPELSEWLKQIEKPLALVVEATRRPDYYNPLVPRRTEDASNGLIGALLPNAQKCREFAAALCCRAMLRASEGKVEEAWQDLLACHRMGRLVARGSSLIEMLVGIAIDRFTSEAELALVDRAKLTSKQIQACLRDLQNLPPMPAFADKLDLGERFLFLDAVMMMASQGVSVLGPRGDMSTNSPPTRRSRWDWDRFFTSSINWDPALRNGNRIYDRLAAGTRLRDRAARKKEMADIDQEVKSWRQVTSGIGLIEKPFLGPKGRGELIGYILMGLFLPAIDKIQTAADRCHQTQDNLHVAFALAAYQRDNGRYPANLDELAPKYLERIPDDLFSGNPLVYRLEGKGYLLYSVGPNENDEQGRSNNDMPAGDDVGVRMPVREPINKK